MRNFTIEDEHYRITVNAVGLISSIWLKDIDDELVKERRLANNFKINLPLAGRLDHYIRGTEEQDVRVSVEAGTKIVLHCDSLQSELGVFPIQADFYIELVSGQVQFSYEIANSTPYPLAEIWYPMIGGLQGIGERLDTQFVASGYTGEISNEIFHSYPLKESLGNEHPLLELGYPGLSMPWLSIFNRKRDAGLYCAELNPVQRRISFVFQFSTGQHQVVHGDCWPSVEEVGAETPIGLTMSKVAYPHTAADRFISGSFVLQSHAGDWHQAAKLYRTWFMKCFPFDKSGSWLRKEQAWFTSVIYQPEDRVVVTLQQYADWMRSAIDIGINTGELIGWDKGGLERDYPEYVPEEKLGGWGGYRSMIRQIHDDGGKVLTFVNYQILDSCTDWYHAELHKYRRMDSFGNTENWMAWGESTLKAAAGLDMRRHLPASVAVPGFTELLDPYFTRLIEEGSDGLQIDKLCVNGKLDFNPGHDRDPDLPMCEDLVQAIGHLYDKCKAINPNVCFASEVNTDRYIPYVDVFYRTATPETISTLRYAFPEWTGCVHASSPFDYAAVNGALMLGAVLVVEPFAYTRPVSHPEFRVMAAYIKECLRIRSQYLDRIFLADYLDRLDAEVRVCDVSTNLRHALEYRVHARYSDGKRAIVVVNRSREPIVYHFQFTHAAACSAVMAQPYLEEREVPGSGELTIEGERVQIILEK